MNSLSLVFWSILAVVGLLLFIKFKPPTIASLLLSKDEAKEISIQFIKEFVGIDVENWDFYSVYWYDHDTVNKLHHLGILKKNRKVLYDVGLVESWRVRFVYQNQSFVVGVNANREITFFYADVPKKSLSGKFEQVPPETLKQRLLASPDGLWSRANMTGTGKKEEDFREVSTYWYIAEAGDIRLKVTVELQGGRISYIGTEQEILTDQMNKVIRDEQVESTFGVSGMLGSALAMILAILILVFMDVQTSIIFSLVLGLFIIICQSLTLKEDIQLTIVNAYDARMSVKTVSLLGVLSTLLTGLLTGFVVFICSLAGNALAGDFGWKTFEQPMVQIFYGIGAGLISLGVTSLLFNLLEKNHCLRISPELSNRTVFLSGFTFRQGLNMSIQSSIGEEVIYRLLMIPVIWWMSGNIIISIIVPSFLWAVMHQVTGYDPRWIRWLHLFIFGCFLGVLFIKFGFICVLAAHFIHNLVLVCMPLWQFKLQKHMHHDQLKHTSL
ncbi:sporulation killing factor biosynthesis protein SkfC [Bacillus atrophaeus]|uniref:sporulation killing factor biosynthesis protein SkfC n=1 Tax=Bacillus atrophaeus TaxID=1452 RepID=UPI002E1A2CB0|nr:sporulation killing factor biosynthesis protein SkfC [Bacillus atrophaeus]